MTETDDNIIHLIAAKEKVPEVEVSFTIHCEHKGEKVWTVKLHDFYDKQFSDHPEPGPAYRACAEHMFDVASGMLRVAEETKGGEGRVAIASVILFSDGSAKIASQTADTEERRNWIKTMMHRATEDILSQGVDKSPVDD